MKIVPIPSLNDQVLKFTVHNFPPLAGRRIVAGYPLSLITKDYSYEKNEEAMLELFQHVSVEVDGKHIHLVSPELIETYIPDWWTLVQLEWEALKYNCSFLTDSDMVDSIKGFAENYIRQMVGEYIESKKGDTPETSTIASLDA